MSALAGSMYLVSTALFSLISLLIGLRLVALSIRNGRVPERLLGAGLALCGGLGYALLIGSALARAALGDEGGAGLTVATWAGKLLHDAGVLCILGFVLAVFRPGVAWARGLFALAAALLFAGLAGYALEGGMSHGRPEGFWYWLEFSVIGSYPVWTAAESFRYYALMRRRRAVGLADPLLADRFLLWGIGSLATLLAIWTVSLPALLGTGIGSDGAIAEGPLLLTAFFGICAVSAFWLTFFPPRWYKARLGASA